MGNNCLLCKYGVIYQKILFFLAVSLLVTIVFSCCQQCKEMFRNFMQTEGPSLQGTRCLAILSNLSGSQGRCRSQSNINQHSIAENTNIEET